MRKEKTIQEVDEGHIVMMLNFFEEMSLSVQMGESHEPMLRRYFKGVVVRGYDIFEPWINDQRQLSASAFNEYLWLVKEWKSEKAQREDAG